MTASSRPSYVRPRGQSLASAKTFSPSDAVGVNFSTA